MFGFSRYNYDEFDRKTLIKDFAKNKFGARAGAGRQGAGFRVAHH